MKTNRFLLSFIVTIIAAISISSCTYRASYNPGYDYGYGPGYGYGYRYAPPPPRVVVVKPPHPHRRVVNADRHRSSRYGDRNYRKQYRSGQHYGNNARTRGPRR
ncbi:hypothetical protein [Dyadobacter sp. CY323]|uniref:hypothetical protein n=1 Tax=Dyadobacter sp. CY323 TaxID=2907302 RepID=UPI001F3ACFAD|nr:hypothetical protein [Dyadobacter sp. CY323]MCE6988715.1 hypothetical protein [Dyadobacter sp. CY323]